jgi:hypothetical protein
MIMFSAALNRSFLAADERDLVEPLIADCSTRPLLTSPAECDGLLSYPKPQAKPHIYAEWDFGDCFVTSAVSVRLSSRRVCETSSCDFVSTEIS